MQRRSVVFVGFVLSGAVGAAALAAIPASTLYGSSTPGPAAMFAGDRLTVAAGYGPVAAPLDVIPLGEGQVSLPGETQAPRLSRRGTNYNIYASRPDPVPGQVTADNPVVIMAAGIGAEDLECKLDQYGRRTTISLERLVAAMKSGIDGLRQDTPLDAIRALVQADLNRSGDGPKVKTSAVELLRANYPAATRTGQALAQPFDLVDNAPADVPGYDPCGNPAAIGGGTFGSGPFASDFATINPVPVVASRLAAATEGGK